MATKADVAAVAEQVVRAREQGKRSATVGGVVFDTVTGGYCARFVRQCHEAALGLPPFGWEFAAPNARTMEQRLRAAGKRTSGEQRGDIICMNATDGTHGHIGIALGDGWIAHNTSSRAWGPGTVATRLAEVRRIVSGRYAVLPGPELQVALLPGSAVIDCHPRLEGGVMRVDLRPVVEALGWECEARIEGESRVYVRRPR